MLEPNHGGNIRFVSPGRIVVAMGISTRYWKPEDPSTPKEV